MNKTKNSTWLIAVKPIKDPDQAAEEEHAPQSA